ncbi:uridine kinase [Echria macrotheca]|uniref:Uridine kinase n=1 Tax=Echria macrotheca TaxID=438768 RepID=A0AAJ0B911_9PEZI|nr:uridine kinase [Echria macrotheca]
MFTIGAAESFPPGSIYPRNIFLDLFALTLLPMRPESRLLVGVDGVDGSGKTTFADELARHIAAADSRPVIRVSLDAFHNISEIRYRLGRRSPEGFWLDSFNLEQFKEYVLEPLRSDSRSIRDRGHSLDTDEVLDPPRLFAAPNAIVLIHGLFLHRDELYGYWDYSVFLDTPFHITAARMAARDGAPVEHPYQQRYTGGQRLYFAAADPAKRASLVLDNCAMENVGVIGPAEASYCSC